ncbi:MAG: ABC transporter ATP-binding protein [Clostridia bacterium]|nr:ABC transporter ATP-binding protein [Clostridia bacterium]
MRILFDELTKVFTDKKRGKKESVVAVDHFSFEIPDGQLIGLLGPSGCGKSTALHLISGLHTPTSGRIYFGDEDMTDVPVEKREVGVVFQNYALYPHLSVLENIMFPLDNLEGNKRISPNEMRSRARAAAKLVQIDELESRRPKELSGGQQQRVAIARALVKQPRVLLLDEPLSNLDARLRLQTREEIRRIQKGTGVTTIFVTHDQEEAMSISDQIVVMQSGRVQQIGKPQWVYDFPANLFVAKFLGTPPINVFRGSIRGGRLFIGKDDVFAAPGLSDQEVWVGIRPEGFILDEQGPLRCTFQSLEMMGRDISVMAGHVALEGERLQALLEAGSGIPAGAAQVNFSLKPDKVHVFSRDTQVRLDWQKGGMGK